MTAGRCVRFWEYVLDFGLTLWVVRVILVAMLLGFAILGITPQAQDLLVDAAMRPWWFGVPLLLTVFFVWALPTHYSARLLVETDARYLQRIRRRKSCFIGWLRTWSPRLLGLLPFAAMLIGVWRAWANVPAVGDADMTKDIKDALALLGILLAASGVLFCVYVGKRRRLASVPPLAGVIGKVGVFTAWLAEK